MRDLALTRDDIDECWQTACRASLPPSQFDASVYGDGPLEYHGVKGRLLAFAAAIEVKMRTKLAGEHAERLRALQDNTRNLLKEPSHA